MDDLDDFNIDDFNIDDWIIDPEGSPSSDDSVTATNNDFNVDDWIIDPDEPDQGTTGGNKNNDDGGSASGQHQETTSSAINKTTDQRITGGKRPAGTSEGSTKSKKAKKAPENKDGGSASTQGETSANETTEVAKYGINIGVSSIPIPVCSCTGTPRRCHRNGSGGWQSTCCRHDMSLYPLPWSTKRRGARLPGRVMNFGRFKKVLRRLVAKGYDFSEPIDLNNHWY